MSKLETNTPAVKSREEYIVIPGLRNSPTQIAIDKRELKMGSANAFKVKDGGLAREIEARHGREGDHSMVVIPIEKRVERGSPRTFRVRLPYEKGFTGDKDAN